MKTYQDILLKTQFYKDKVLKDLIRNGVSPSREDIDAAVNRIDRFIAVYRHKDIEEGSRFDMEEFHRIFTYVREDLKILYKVVYELSIKEYESLYAQIESYIRGLESSVASLRARSDVEIGSTSLGETIFFQGSGFETYRVNEDTFVELGDVNVREGDTIALIFHGENVSPENVIMSLKDEDQVYYLAPYNYMQDVLHLFDTSSRKMYVVKEREDQIINSSFQVQAEGLVASQENRYRIMAGKDSAIVKNMRGEALIGKNEHNSYYEFEPGTIQLYVYGGSYARFSFSKMPEGKNFEGTVINSMEKIHRIEIDSQGDLGFEIMTDGEVYAEMNSGTVRDGKLYYPVRSHARDFLVEETLPGKIINMEGHLRITSKNGAPVKVRSIAIKALSSS